MDEEYAEQKSVVNEFMQAHMYHRRVIERKLHKTGVFRGQHHLIMYLMEHPGLSQVEIAEGLGITPATVAVIIKKLEIKGYIKKEINGSDNRFNIIELTTEGREIVAQNISIFHEIDKIMLLDFSKEELRQLKDYLNRMKLNLSYLEKKGLIEGEES